MPYNIIYASCKGKKDGHPYQDFIQVVESDRYTLATLADGLGSSKFSSRGASLICSILAEQFEKGIFTSSSISDILESSISCWYNRLEEKGFSTKDFLTTSSLMFLMKGQKIAYFAHIGDSLLAYRCNGDELVCITEDKDFLNETSCIGTDFWPSYDVKEVAFKESIDFIIASDGFGDEICLENIGGLFDYFIESYSRVKYEKRNKVLKNELVEAMRVKNNDDKSIIFGWIR